MLTNRDEISNIYREPSIDASYQVSNHLAKRFQRRRFFTNQSIRNKNCLWQPCLLLNLDKMSNLYRDPSIDDSYQVLVHLTKQFQRKRFLEIDQAETRIDCDSHVCYWIGTKWPIIYRASSIDASYYISVHLAKQLQRRFFFRNRLIKNKNCLWWPCLLMDQDEMSIFY